MANKKTIKIMLGIFLAAYVASLILVYSTEVISEGIRLKYQNILYLLSPLIAVAGGIYAINKYSVKSIQGKAILLLTLGFFSWFIGEIIFAVMENYFMIKPFPSLADFFYIIAYPLFLLGILQALKLGKISWTKKNIAISIIIFVFLALITSYFGIYHAYNKDLSMFENIVAMSYGVGDLVILVSLIILVNLSIEFSGGIFSKSWLTLSLGFGLWWIADILFAIYNRSYEDLNWAYRQIDYLWIISYIFAGYAFYIQADALSSFIKSVADKNKRKKEAKP